MLDATLDPGRHRTHLDVGAPVGSGRDLTVLLDIDPVVGLTRFSTPADRLEAEPLAFHQRVREQFLAV